MRFKAQAAFSFIEVMVAMVILSISLVVLMESQARSMTLVSRAEKIDAAVSLAGAKISELSENARAKGLTALREEEAGEFDQEKHPGYKWRYRLSKVPAPDFGAMMGLATGDEEGSSQAQNAALFAGPLQAIARTWGNALRELRVEVLWNEGNREMSYELVTHLVAPDAANQIQGLVGAINAAAGALQGGGGQR